MPANAAARSAVSEKSVAARMFLGGAFIEASLAR
jgi:hypothetical protein